MYGLQYGASDTCLPLLVDRAKRLIFGAGGRKLKKGKERKGERGEGEGRREGRGRKRREEETVEEEEVLLMIRLLC